ncbi:hypothetical protein QTP88_001763 [Uroleucon formosanum]
MGQSSKAHKCFMKWSKGATSIEADAIAEGFLSSVKLHGLKYNKLIGNAHNAVRHFFPNCKIMACRFHSGQSWLKKIQSDSNVLKNYNSKSELGVWLKQFFALRFLPSEDVENAFTYLIENSPTDNFEFTDYILNNYISSDAAFPPILWATEPSTEARTTNGPESFHKHYNAQFYKSHPSIDQVIHILLDIQSE